MAVSLRARVVFPVDRPPIEHGVVTIDGERIVAVGPKAEASEVVDLGDVALLPGLVNAHTHLEFSNLWQPLGEPGMPLPEWIRLVIAERGRRDYSAPLAIEEGFHESIGCGVTSIGDITTVDAPAHYFPRVDLTLFMEVIAFSRARALSALAALMGRMVNESPIDYYQRATAGIQFGVSPHAPYTVSPTLVGHLVKVAKERSLPIAMHIAESRDELQLLHDGTGPFQELLEERSMWDAEAIPRGFRPLDYLQMLAGTPRALVIHGNYLDDEELAFLGAKREWMSLVYCPRTHAYFGHEPYPLSRALDAGVCVALGTDSRASNPDLDLLAEMRFVAKQFPAIGRHEILKMGTLAGAEALGRAHEVGSLTAWKVANLVAVPIEDGGDRDADAILEGLLAADSAASAVWLRGELVERV